MTSRANIANPFFKGTRLMRLQQQRASAAVLSLERNPTPTKKDLKLFYISSRYASVEPVSEWTDSITFLTE